jgi:valyl-tRNA synthetase
MRALFVFDKALRLLHPVMPFISEELWQNLTERNGATLIRAKFPVSDPKFLKANIERDMGLFIRVIEAIRNIRGELNVPPSKQIGVHLYLHGSSKEKVTADAFAIQGMLSYVNRLCKAETTPHFVSDGERIEKPTQSASAVVDSTEIFVPLAGLIDLDAEQKRLEKEIARLQGLIDATERKLSNPSFVDKAPKEVVEKEREKVISVRANADKLKENLAAFLLP